MNTEEELLQELNEDFNSYKVIITVERITEDLNVHTMYENLILSSFYFELRTMVGLMLLENDKWNSSIWSRHGGEQYSKWWFDNRCQARPIQLDDVDNIHTFIQSSLHL